MAAFGKDSGYTNLNNGVFSSVIYSKQAQIAFRKASVAQAITNSEYFGEIANQGDTVRILKEPDITVNALLRGTTISTQDLVDNDFQLTIDKANYFAFKLDDIEEQQAHHDFMSLASDRAAYKMADSMDADLLSYMSGYTTAGALITTTSGTAAASSGANSGAETLAAHTMDATDFTGQLTGVTGEASGDSIPVAPRMPGATGLSTTSVSPLQIVARMARLMDVQNVDTRGRWIVVDPVFMEMLKDEDSRVLQADWGGSGLMNGLVLNSLHGFRVYMSNNLPAKGSGPGASTAAPQSTNYGVIVSGHDSAVASAQQISKVETYRDPDSFADIVRGMHLYGRKILRPEGLVSAIYNVA